MMKFHQLLLILVLINISCFTNTQKVKQNSFPYEDLCDYVGNRLIAEFNLSGDSVSVILINRKDSKSEHVMNFNNCLKESLVTNYKFRVANSEICLNDGTSYCLLIQNISNINGLLSFDYILGNQSESIVYKLLYNIAEHEVSSDEFQAIIVK